MELERIRRACNSYCNWQGYVMLVFYFCSFPNSQDICAYNMAHNAETEACDVLMEIERLDQLSDFVDANDQPRVCRYLLRYVIALILNQSCCSCVPYVPDPENTTLIRTAYDLCMKHDAKIDALRCA